MNGDVCSDDKGDPAGKNGGNSRRRGGHGGLVVGQGLTTGEIAAHLAEVHGADVSRQTISTITDKGVEA